MVRRTRSALYDEDAAEKIKTAASVAGFASPEELCEAVLSSGIPSKNENGLDERSIQEVGKYLFQRMAQKNDAAPWFKRLTTPQKGALVCYLKQKGFPSYRIAEGLGITETIVRETWDAYADELGKTITGIRASTVVGDVVARADELYSQAVEHGNHALAWRIVREKTSMLQDFGILEKAVFRQEVTHKLSLDQAAEDELELMLANREKKRIAHEKVKMIDQELDRSPAATQDGGGEGDETLSPIENA